MAALVKANDEFVRGRPDGPFGRDEEAVQLLGISLLVTSQLLAEPPIAAVGQNGHSRVQVHIEPDLARQAVEMKKVYADPESVFYAVAPRITDD